MGIKHTPCVALSILCLCLTACDEPVGLHKISSGTLSISGAFLFSKTTPGQRETKTVSIKNIGDDTVTMLGFSKRAGPMFSGGWRIVGPHGKGMDGGRDGLPKRIVIAPQETLRLSLSFHPKVAQTPNGSIRFRTNSGLSHQESISLPIAGLRAVGELHADSRSLHFGRVAIGERTQKILTITNLGTDIVYLQDLSVVGSAYFDVSLGDKDPRQTPTILVDPDGDGVPGLSAGAQFKLTVGFKPDSLRTTAGELQIRSNAENQKMHIELMGNAAAPCVQVVPGPVEFPATSIGGKRLVPVRIESCGGQAVRLEAIEISMGASHYSMTNQPQLPLELPAIDPDQASRPGLDLLLAFEPDAERLFQGTLVVKSTDPELPERQVPLSGRGVENQCPVPQLNTTEIQVHPLDIVTLDGSASTDSDGPGGQPTEYYWTVVERPEGSTSQPVGSFHDINMPANGGVPAQPNASQSAFFVDLAGNYVLALSVVDEHGARAPSSLCPDVHARLHIRAVPGEKLHVQLTWDTPGDADQTDDFGTDVDLHLRHPNSSGWFQLDDLDCHYQNTQPDWGRQGDHEDDPSLDIDDVNGAGPENINLARPENTGAYPMGYQVGVHYFSAEGIDSFDTSATLESHARVRIFIDGRVAFEGQRTLRQTDDFWHVGQIQFDGGGGRVTEDGRLETIIP